MACVADGLRVTHRQLHIFGTQVPIDFAGEQNPTGVFGS